METNRQEPVAAKEIPREDRSKAWRGQHSRSLLENMLVALAAGLAVWFFCFTFQPITESYDYFSLWTSNFHFLTESVMEGRLPLWNPYVGLGRPFLADMQTAAFYPPVYLMLLGEPVGLFLLLWLHMLLAIFGMRSLALEFGARRPPAYLAGFAFVLCAANMARLHLGHVMYICGLCYVPILFLHAARIESCGWACLGRYAGLLALQFLTGHPQAFWISAWAQGAFIAARSIQLPLRNSLIILVRSLGKLAIAGLWCLLLTAVVLLPFLELVKHANRGASHEFSAYVSLSWLHFIGLITQPPVSEIYTAEAQMFIGCTLLLPGLAALTNWRDRNIRGLAAALLLAILVSTAGTGMHYDFFLNFFPGYGSFRLHAKSAVIVCFVLILASALWLSGNAWDSRKQRILLAIGAGLLALILFVFSTQTNAEQPLSLTVPAATVLATTLGYWVIAQNWRPKIRPWFFAVIAGTSIISLAYYSFPVPIPENTLRRLYHAENGKALHSELEKRGFATTGGPPARIWLQHSVLPSNDAMILKLGSCDCFGSLFLNRPWQYLHRGAGVEPSLNRSSFLNLKLYDRGPFPYKHLPLQASWSPDENPPVKFADPGQDAWRARVVFGAKRVNGAEAALQAVLAADDIRQTAFVESEPSPALPATPSLPSRVVPIRQFTPNDFVINVDAPQNALLVVAEAWYPGWRARIKDEVIDAQPVNYWMRGFAVPAGTYEVHVFYEQNYLIPGAILSIMGLLLLGGVHVLSWHTIKKPLI